MSIHTNNQTLNLNEQFEDRNESVKKIVRAMSFIACLTELPETIQYNLFLHAKKIEKMVFEKSASPKEYQQLLMEKLANIRADIEEMIQNLPEEHAHDIAMRAETSSSSNAELNRQEWRRFYSSTVRSAVVNAFVEEVRSKIKIPMKFTMGLRLGVEAMEEIAYKESNSKVEYFRILERRKAQITSELVAYFKCENDE